MLNHIRIVDLTNGLGAIAGRMLAELGATVIKAEPESGDPQRADAPAFAAWNHGKRSVIAEPGDAAFTALIASADIVIRNPGLDHAVLMAANPALIDVVVAAFLPGGQNGGRPASDLTLMARSGLMTIIGDPDRAPLTLPGEQAFALGGIQAVTAALTALYARGSDGKGQLIEVSAYQSAVLANYREPLTWEWTGRVGNRTGNLLIRGKSGVRQMWPCKDGFVTWALVDNPPMMRGMVRVMGDQAGPLSAVDWDAILVADTPRETLLEWEGHVEAFFLSLTRAELGALSTAHGLGLSWIDTPHDVLQSEQMAARSLWRDIDGVALPGPLWVSSLTQTPRTGPPPALGEDNAARLGGEA
jgi:crotonobetainyl-CoA:carnitine CoA-transferase CaiB-like acyl-CoA transferase